MQLRRSDAATTENRLFGRAAIALLIVGCLVAVFWQQLAGIGVFIGESDRLNSYLNIRLAEFDSLRELGRVSNWDRSMFGGFSLAALHWMQPGTDPIAWFLQFFARPDVYFALQYTSILSVLAACVAAYLYIRELVGPGLAAAAGAICYGLSVFSIHRMAQVDNAHLTIVLLPLAMLAIRRIALGQALKPFVALCAILTALASWGFLQEVAYAYYFLGVYSLYRALISRPEGWRAVVLPLMAFGLAASIALIFALPRLVTVASEFTQLSRTTTINFIKYNELLRFFHEGIFGRTLEEAQLMGGGKNLHEGLQLASSSMLGLFVCFGIMRASRWIEAIPALVFAAMLLALSPPFKSLAGGDPTAPTLSIVLNFVALGIILALLIRCEPVLRIGGELRKFVPDQPRPTDATFHLYAVVVLLALILTPEGYKAVYWLFGGIDFSHSRLSVLIILPLSTLFSVYLAELKSLPLWKDTARPDGRPAFLWAAGIAALVGLVAWSVHGDLIDHLVPLNLFKLHLRDPISTQTAIKLLLTIGIFAVLLVPLAKPRALSFVDGRLLATFTIAAFAIVETTTYAHFKIAGAQTWTFPTAFRSFNYLNVPPWAMRPPNEEALAKFSSKLEVEKFRSILINLHSPHLAVNTSHIAEFWHARMIGGYGTGVPSRLADLPWPKDVRTLRTIELNSMRDISPQLLALLNVKYIVVVTPDLYFNVDCTNLCRESGNILTLEGVDYPGEIVTVDGIRFGLIRNLEAPLPRHFLVESVTGVTQTPRLMSDKSEPSSSANPVIHDVSQLLRHSLVENFVGTKRFDAGGNLQVIYRGDVIDVAVTPSDRERFVVLNERYHRDWHAQIGGVEIPVFPANAVMMGIELRPGTDHVRLTFVPFSARAVAALPTYGALLLLLVCTFGFWMLDRRTAGFTGTHPAEAMISAASVFRKSQG